MPDLEHQRGCAVDGQSHAYRVLFAAGVKRLGGFSSKYERYGTTATPSDTI